MPRSLEPLKGSLALPGHVAFIIDPSLPIETAREIGRRLWNWNAGLHARSRGVRFDTSRGRDRNSAAIVAVRSNSAPSQHDGYSLAISPEGVRIEFREIGGLHSAIATLRQLLREHGRRLPCLKIRDWADFARRGVMLDVSRGRVPKLETLLDLADKLAGLKINELQLYTEHTFAYHSHRSVWQSWGALTGMEIRRLDNHCRELGIDLVPNQNSFGHLRYFLEHPRLKKLAEVSEPYADASGEFVRRPSTLAPNHPDTLPFLRGLYDELLPNFSSRYFNVGCDETWDLGLGQSKALCKRIGKGRVYIQFLKKIQRDIARRGCRMMFWGDIILKYPELIPELATIGKADRQVGQHPRQDAPASIIGLNWGYEANHPFGREARLFARSGIPFYVCPGTSTWMTMIGRHDNAFANLRAAAVAGRKHGAIGYLIADWGDGGHPQPLAVSWLPFAFGAGISWCAQSIDEKQLSPVLNRDVFHDPTGRLTGSALALGLAHLKLRFKTPNETPLGTVIAAPEPETHELFCRNGLNHHTRIATKNIRSALVEINAQLDRLETIHTASVHGSILLRELKLAARMAAFSCDYMLWQKSATSRQTATARRQALQLLDELRGIQRNYNALWPLRNKASPKHSSAFLTWRRNELQRWLSQRA